MKLIIFAMVLGSLIGWSARAHAPKLDDKKLGQMVGNWTLSKGEKFVCPDSLEINNKGKNQMTLKSVRPKSSASYTFTKGKLSSFADETNVKKAKGGPESNYKLIASYNTSIVNNRLLTNHLWSAEGETWSSTGTKVYGLKDAKTLVLEKAITGYGERDDKYKKTRTKLVDYFKHSKEYGLNAASFSCEYSKSKLQASK